MSGKTKTLAKSQIYTLKGEPVSSQGDVRGRSSIAACHLAGETIDQKYKIIRLLGEGGMGAVYQAHHLMLDKDVALKTFNSPNFSSEARKRFEREAQAIGRLSHPNIVQIYDFGVGEDNVPYYTMECLSGESLEDRLAARGSLPVDEAVEIFLQVCRGLAQAHSKGIIHRDLKPANIFLANNPLADKGQDIVKIVDFGLAGLASQSLDEQRVTPAGTIFGSPLYMSPEQSLGEDLTAASDIYSCGCALFQT